MKSDKANKYFQLAKHHAELFSKDPVTKVCALFIAPDSLNVLTSGVNGLPRNVKEKEERLQRPTKYSYMTHSEINGLCNAARHGICLDKSIVIVTMFPCCDCAKALIQVGVSTIITVPPNYEDPKWGGHFRISMEMFEEVGIEVVLIDESQQCPPLPIT